MNQDHLTEVVGAVFSSMWDAPPVVFKRNDEIGVSVVLRALQQENGRVHRLRRQLNRNAFLCGCLDFTEHEPIEHLIVGFGRRSGAATKIHSLLRVVGSAGYVPIPNEVETAIGDFFASGHSAEVILFHNHPKSALDVASDCEPIASGADRRTLVGSWLKPLPIIKALTGGGRLKFFVGQNGFVREFRTPQLSDLL